MMVGIKSNQDMTKINIFQPELKNLVANKFSYDLQKVHTSCGHLILILLILTLWLAISFLYYKPHPTSSLCVYQYY